MPKVRANTAANAVSEAAPGTNVIEQARRKSAPKRLIEYGNGVIVGIIPGGPKGNHVNVALVHVFFRNDVVAGLGGMILNFILWQFAALGPGLKYGPQPRFHDLGIEVAAYAEDHVIGMNVGFVPINQVLPRNGCDCGIFRLT